MTGSTLPRASADEGASVLLRREGALARLTLNRPRAINALTLEMVRRLHAALDQLERDGSVHAVLLDGAGERGFCAGGDIVALHRSAQQGTADARTFWREEYALNARIANFSLPIVAIMDGIVMGGGIGLAGHARHRIATERLTAAMPEVGIGFAPDVGGTWLLSRAPGELGTHLALTATRVGAADALLVGLADAVIEPGDVDALRGELALAGSPGEVDAIVRRHTSASTLAGGELAAQRGWIDQACAGDDPLAIVRALERAPSPAGQAAAAAIRRASPTSVAVTLRALRDARGLPSLEAALARELEISCALLRHPDFVEGVRAQVIDKDRQPHWQPSSLEQLDPAAIDRLFATFADARTGEEASAQ